MGKNGVVAAYSGYFFESGEKSMNLTDISFEQLLGLAAVILVLVGIYNTLMTAIKNHMEAKRRHDAPVDTLKAQIENHKQMLANDKKRLDDMELQIHEMQTELSMMLRGVRALLSHEINGNSIDKLQESYNTIDEYLLNKGGRIHAEREH